MSIGCEDCDFTGVIEVDWCEQVKCKCSVKNDAVREQPMPKKNDLPFIKDLVAKDLEERAEIGKSRYGTYLQPHNGRDALQDAYEEVQDLLIYFRQLKYERDGK